MNAKSKCMTCYAYGHREGFGEGYEQGKKEQAELIYKQLRRVNNKKRDCNLPIGDFLNWLQDIVIKELSKDVPNLVNR